LRALDSAAVGTYRTRRIDGLRHLDAADGAGIQRLLSDVQPDVVFFPAAEPNVDWCELHATEAYQANVVPAVAALRATEESGARFVFFSSDYVFDGERGPYVETDPVNPQSVYAQHKREIEERVLDAGQTVVRTTSVFGQEVAPGNNFVLRVVARLAAGEVVTAPSDQVSTPTWADDLALGAIRVAERGGIWHVAGPDLLARDQFARLVADVFGLDASLVRSVSTFELQQPARRPLTSGLNTDKLLRETGLRIGSLRSALERFRDSLQATA
jgi:dTDP-4-dehydrorhamnose reductase